MDAIALAASVGKGTLFRAFGNRDGLLDALWAAKIATLKASVESSAPPFDASTAPPDRLVAFLDAILMFKIANRHLIRAQELSGDYCNLRIINGCMQKRDAALWMRQILPIRLMPPIMPILC
ncbi:TetR family transcriptional regulator [Komagataeibacter rhaeticus]|nr:TetR family transcriptional regulator [Komagataeibacter rhaeticus]